MKWKHFVLLLLLFGLVSGCWVSHKEWAQRQPNYWTKPYFNEQECNKAIAECGQLVSGTVPRSIVLQKAYGLDSSEAFDSCMEKKGYQKKK